MLVSAVVRAQPNAGANNSCTSAEQRPYSNHISNVSDKSPNVSRQSTVPSIESKHKQSIANNNRDSSSSPICCYSTVCKINNHKSNQSAEIKEAFDGVAGVVGKSCDKKRARRIRQSPTQFHSVDAVGDSSEFEYAHRTKLLKPNETHRQHVQTTVHNVNDHLNSEQFDVDAKAIGHSGRQRHFHCFNANASGEQCCCLYCLSDCQNDLAHTLCTPCDRNQCREYYQPRFYHCCTDANDNEPRHPSHTINNNCKLYKNRNSSETAICTAAERPIGQLTEFHSDIDDVHPSSALCVDAFTSSPYTWDQSDKLPRINNNQTDSSSMLKSANHSALKLTQRKPLACGNRSHSENCSDCIQSLNKDTFDQRNRTKASAKFTLGHSKSVTLGHSKSVDSVDYDQKLVFCTKNVTAQREIAKTFTIGVYDTKETRQQLSTAAVNYLNANNLRKNWCGTKSIPKTDKSNCIATAVRFKNNNGCKNSYDLNIKNDNKNRLTSASAKTIIPVLSSSTQVNAELHSAKYRYQNTPPNDDNDNDDNKRCRRCSDCKCGECDRKTFVAPFNDNPEKLCHTDKLNLADATTATATVGNGLAVRQLFGVNLKQHQLNGATTQQASAALQTLADLTNTVDGCEQRDFCDLIVPESSLNDENKVLPIIEHSNDVNQLANIQIVEIDGNISGDGACEKRLVNNANVLVNLQQQKVLVNIDCGTDLSDEHTLFEHKPIPSIQETSFYQSGLLRRRASFEHFIDSNRKLFVAHHRRTNSSDGDDGGGGGGNDATDKFPFDRFSRLNRSCIESIAEKLRFVQNTDHRYAQSLAAVS